MDIAAMASFMLTSKKHAESCEEGSDLIWTIVLNIFFFWQLYICLK